MWIIKDPNKDKRRYNLPCCNEIAVVFSSVDGAPPIDRDIGIHLKKGKNQRIHPLSQNCDALCYPILFPKGEHGWSIELGKKYKITPLQFYTNRFAIRPNVFNPILHAGKLTQQYIVDIYTKDEGDRLQYIRQNQNQLRVELYSGLMDYLKKKNNNNQQNIKPGNICILPSSFIGSPRAMQQLSQDGMAIVRVFGKADLYIMFLCKLLH